MRILLNIFIMVMLYSFSIACKNKDNGDLVNYYHGYVLDQNKKSIKGVKVYEYIKRIHCTETDSTGYFILPQFPDMAADLIFVKEGYKTDTVETLMKNYQKVYYKFVYKVPDTLIMQSIR